MNKMTVYGPGGTSATNDAALGVFLDVLLETNRLIGVETRIGRPCSDVNVPCDCLVCTHQRDGMLVVDFIDSDGRPSVFRVGGVGERFAAYTRAYAMPSQVA